MQPPATLLRDVQARARAIADADPFCAWPEEPLLQLARAARVVTYRRGAVIQAQGTKLNLQVGFSHPVAVDMPAGVKVECPTQTEIVIKGADRQAVGQVAAEVRAIRPPEPYKGKGIRYADERVVLKETKKK